jgi:FAD/FMN-containing dehydrogenase
MEGYEHLRRGEVWHGGVPERYPTIIVVAHNENDVVGAVRLARRENLQVAVRSGGHSWSASHLRDGTVLIDLSNLRRVEVDTETMTAVIEPAIQGMELLRMLQSEGLFFPVGHSPGVGIGGYLLQGGFGWAGREYGPACMSVIGIDVVTADGELVHASETENSDLLWAARGAGPGFFAIVTRFYLRLYAARAITMNSTYIYDAADASEVCEFVHRIGRESTLELDVLIQRHPLTNDEPMVLLSGIAYTDSEEDAIRELAVLETCSARPRALQALINQPAVHGGLELNADAELVPLHEDWSWMADNVGTNADFAELRPNLEEMIKTFPASPSNLLLFNWGGYAAAPARPPMAFSLEADLYYAVYIAWENPADAAEHVAWTTEHMRAWEPFEVGTMLADENLINRPVRFMSDENLQRLDRLRGEWDPTGMFVSWLGRPSTEAAPD